MNGTFEGVKTGTYLSGEDLNAESDLYHFVKLNAAGRIVKTTAATDVAIGVLAVRAPAAGTGQAVTVAKINGSDKLRVRAGAAITRGNLVVMDASGDAIGVAALANVPQNGMAVGVCMETVADTQIFTFSASPLFKSA